MSKKWNPYKEEILRLYLVENMTLDQVMDHMLQIHRFDQKKSQYEYRLKLWGARKNLKKEALEYISHQDRRSRKQSGRNPGVYIVDGILLSDSRVHRAQQRHNFDLSLARKYLRAPSPKLPPGHLIRRSSLPAIAISIDWPGSLPWLRFEERFKIVAPKSSSFIQALARTANHCGLIAGMGFNDSTNLARAIYAASHETCTNAANVARMLPCVPKNSHPSTMDIALSNSDDAATKILKAFMFQVSNKLEESEGDRPWEDGLLLLFEELEKTNPMVLDHLIDSNDSTSEAIIESLYVAAIEYGATALAIRLLKAGRDANALLPLRGNWQCQFLRGRAFLQFKETLVSMTALQFAAIECDTQLATALIDAGAKADLGTPTPLQISCLTPNFRLFSSPIGHRPIPRHPDALRFANLLMSNGARVDGPPNDWISPLEAAVLSKDISLVRFLIQHGATDVLKWHTGHPNTRRLEYVLYVLLRSPGRKGDKVLLPGENCTEAPPTSALQMAIMAEESIIARDLISSIIEQEDRGAELLEKALITACVAKDQDLAQEVLKNLGSQLEHSPDLIDSALLVTAWDMECKVAQLLLEHEAVRRKLQNSCVSAFQGAALQGNTNLIRLLHSNGFDLNSVPKLRFKLEQEYGNGHLSPPAMLSTPLGCAVWMGHKDAIEVLLNLGATIAGIDLIPAIRTGSHKLLTQLIDRYSNASKSRRGQSVLDIAIRYGIGLTMICKLIDTETVYQGHEFVEAVRSDDLEVVAFFLPRCDLLATNPSGENVVEAASRTGNVKVALDYFATGGVYGSRALFLAVSRAVKMDDYGIIESIIANRPPGPVDEYEASALALSIRMDNTTLMDILLHDAFRPSAALAIYCQALRSFTNRLTDDIRHAIYPLCFDDLGLCIQEVAPKPCFKHHRRDCHHRPRCNRRSYCAHRIACKERFSPLFVAAVMAQERVVRKLLECGYLVDPYLFTLLYHRSYTRKGVRDMIVSAYDSQISSVADQDWHRRMLLVGLEFGVDLGIVQKHFAKLPSLNFHYRQEGYPLEKAIRSRTYERVKAVLEAGATANWHNGDNILKRAIHTRSTEIVSFLLENGVDIDRHPHERFSEALHTGNFGIVALLLNHGLDINAPLPEHGGHTCLESAAENGTIDAVEMLWSRGVEVQGRTRIHFVRSVVLATNNCHYTMVKLLKERGGWNNEDDELAKTPRARDGDHTCLRFLYGDPTFQGCYQCDSATDTSSMTDFSEGEEDATDFPRSWGVIDEQFTSDETSPITHDMSLLDIEPEAMDQERTTEMYEWPVIPYVEHDWEFDVLMSNMDAQFNYHQQTDEVHEWPVIPYGQQDMELDAIVQGLLLEDGIIS